MPVKLGVSPLRLHWLLKPLDAGRIGCKSIEITLPLKPLDARSNLTSRIGGKSIEIITTKFDQAYNVISIGYHPSDFHPI